MSAEERNCLKGVCIYSDNVKAMLETSQKRQTSLWIKLSDYSRERNLYYWGFEDKPKCVSWKAFSGCVKKISQTQRAKNSFSVSLSSD